MKAYEGLEKSIITDDLMSNSPASATVVFLKNLEKLVTLPKSKFLQLDVKLKNVNAIPIFIDSDTPMVDRNNKLIGSPDVRKSFCRNPAPDSFILSHRILKGYNTKVGRMVCSRAGEGLCPDDVKVRESYYQRQPRLCNGRDHSMFSNSKLYCGSYVHLALLFGISKSKFKEGSVLSFNDIGCQYLYQACVTCKKQICSGKNDKEPCKKQCDFICLKYREKNCVKVPKPCSQGDISEWSMKTGFGTSDGRKRFNCYLKRKIPNKVFEILYRVRIPSSRIKTNWFRVTSPQSVKGQEIKLGFFKAEYEKKTVLPDSIILSGQTASKGSLNDYNFKTLVLKDIPETNANASRKEFRFMPSDSSLFVLRNWRDISNCNMLSSWRKYFKQPQPSMEDVTVEKIGNIGRHFAYRINQKLNPTKMKLSLSNGVSVLKKFARVSHITMLNSTLGGDHFHWRINITGNITACPGFIKLSVVEKTTMLLVLKQDVLVLCPMKYFHVAAVIPKEKFDPSYKARMFIAYLFDGTHVYETRMEKRIEIRVDDFIHGSRSKKPPTLFDYSLLAKFDAISIVTGVLLLGLIALVLFSCLFRPIKRATARGKRKQQKPDEEEKLICRHLLPILFLVAIRVAYSFLLTVSFIIILFKAVNESDLEVLKDFNSFVKLKINQSNQIGLALDQFRESEIKVMTDKAAFIECACDYHIGRIMRNMRDNMTALVQLHDLISFDKVSEILLQAILNRFNVVRVIDAKIRHYKTIILRTIKEIEGRLIRYAFRVYKNTWFSGPRALFGPWVDARGVNFLNQINVFDINFYYKIRARLIRELNKAKAKLSAKNIIRRLKKPLYPLVNALLAPVRSMKSKVKNAVKGRIDKLKNKVLRKLQCFGDVDMRKWVRHKDDYDEMSRERCRLKAANKFVKKIVDGAKGNNTNNTNNTNNFLINSVRNDAAFNILDGDAKEQEYESKQESKLAALKKVSAFYTHNKEIKTAMNLVKKHSIVIILVFDILLILYRNLKTYRFAFMMAAGYEVIKEHKRPGEFNNSSGTRKHRSARQTVIRMLTSPILLFFKTFNLMFKLIFTSLIIPVVVVAAIALGMFYVAIAFAHNGLNVDTLDKLGALKLLSARLDVNYNLTSESLKEQETYLNKFDLGMYKESVRVQTEELRNTAKEFNEAEIIRVRRVEAELCDIDSKLGCKMNFRSLMEKLEMKVKPCAFPVIKARMPNNIYDRAAYHRQLKYEIKIYVDALRRIILRTFYIILGIIGTILVVGVMSKLIFKFLKSMGMIRTRNKHIYHELPDNIKERYDSKL